MRLFVWNKRDDLVRKDGVTQRGTVIVIAGCLTGAIQIAQDPAVNGLPQDTVTDQIHNLPDINAEVRCKTVGVWAFPE